MISLTITIFGKKYCRLSVNDSSNKKLTQKYAPFKTVQHLSATFFATDNNIDVNQDNIKCLLCVYSLYKNLGKTLEAYIGLATK